jgi:membrane fusion protein, heavy metal efflux system
MNVKNGSMHVAGLVIALALIPGCRSDSTSSDASRRETPVPHPEPTTGSSPSTLRIRPEMLRDLRITTKRVQERPAGEAVTALGELRVDESAHAEVGAPIAARAVRLLASPGETVRAGQPLVELQSGELGKARADLASARSRKELARLVLARKMDLAAEHIVPAREVQEAESQVVMAEAEVRSAQAALQALGAEGDERPGDSARFVLRSPIRGTVIERAVVLGQMVDPNKALFEIADLGRLWLIVHAFERDAVRLAAGAEARVTLPAMPGRVFSGTVTLVGRRVDAASRTVPVRVELPNPDQTLRPGMSGTAAIPLSDAGGRILTVPVAALQRVQDHWVVFLPQAQGVFEVRSVGRGRDLNGDVEILNGLGAGDTVVVEGSFLLKAEADKTRGEGAHEGHED